MHWNQSDMSLVSNLADNGVYLLAWIIGLFYDRCGPELTSIASAVMVWVGYILTYFAARGMVAATPLAVGMYLFISSQGNNGGYFSAMMANMSNFSARNRGKVTGLLVSFYGLSAFFLTSIHRASLFDVSTTENALRLHAPPLQNYLLFLAVYPAAVILLGSLIFSDLRPEDGWMELTAEDSSLLSTAEITKASSPATQAPEIAAQPQCEITPLQLFCDVRAYLLFIAFIFLTAPGLVYINNVGFLIKSMHGSNSFKDNQVMLLSICNASGRLLYGLGSDFTITYFSRFVWFLFSCVGFIVGYGTIVLFSESSATVSISTVLIGLSYGGIWSIWPSQLRDMFGSKHFGTNSGILGVAPGIGITLFGMAVGHIYDSHATHDGENTTCYGPECFRLSFLIMMGSALCAAVFTVALFFVHRAWFKRWQASRLPPLAVIEDPSLRTGRGSKSYSTNFALDDEDGDVVMVADEQGRVKRKL